MVGYRFNTIGVSDGISMGTRGESGPTAPYRLAFLQLTLPCMKLGNWHLLGRIRMTSSLWLGVSMHPAAFSRRCIHPILPRILQRILAFLNDHVASKTSRPRAPALSVYLRSSSDCIHCSLALMRACVSRNVVFAPIARFDSRFYRDGHGRAVVRCEHRHSGV